MSSSSTMAQKDMPRESIIPGDTIVLKDICKTYQSSGGVSTEALQGVNLTVPRGDFVAIKGASGSGKSSLLHVIGLLDRHYEGSYFLDGEEVHRLRANQAANIRNQKIGFIFQQFNLLKRTTVLQNVLLPAMYRSRRDDERRAVRVIKRVGLLEQMNKKSNQLSGGQIQRVAIARALMMNPCLLLADEPTGNLDTKTAHGIMDLFADINSAGTTIVLITHEDDIAAYANRLVHLVDGAIARENHVPVSGHQDRHHLRDAYHYLKDAFFYPDMNNHKAKENL